MILDIIILVIIAISAVSGFHRGFVYTIVHLAGWAVSLVAAFLLTPAIKEFAKGHTGFNQWLQDGFSYRFDSLNNSITASTDSLPSTLRSIINSSADSLTSNITATFSDLVLTICVFFLTVLLLKAISFLLLRLVTKHYKKRINGLDGFFGILIGLVRGVLYACLFLTALIPFSNLMAPDFTTAVSDSLATSFAAGWVYDNNFLLLLLQFAFGS